MTFNFFTNLQAVAPNVRLLHHYVPHPHTQINSTQAQPNQYRRPPRAPPPGARQRLPLPMSIDAIAAGGIVAVRFDTHAHIQVNMYGNTVGTN